MKPLIKHISFIFFLLCFVFILILGSKLLLKPTQKIYAFIPEDSEIVIEINLQNFVKEIAFQKVFNTQNEELALLEEISADEIKKLLNSGIDVNSKAILFCEKWTDNYIWYAVLTIDNKNKFSDFAAEKELENEVHYVNNYALIQLNHHVNQEMVSAHIQDILQQKVKSILSSDKITHDFNDENEINAYINIENSTHFNEGCISLNFMKNKIDLSGFFHPKASNEQLNTIEYESDKNLAFSLVTTLNLLNFFDFIHDGNKKKTPNYNQLALNFDGTILKTTNNAIPVDIYPDLNLSIGIDNRKSWEDYLIELSNEESITMKADSMVFDLQAKIFFQFLLSEQSFDLFQSQKKFKQQPINNYYLSLFAQPSKFIDKTFFQKDEMNPPKIIANMKINVIKTILDDFQYLKNIDTLSFDIFKENENEDFISKGSIVFKSQNSHSIISSLLLYQNFMNTFGIFLE